MIKGLKKIEIIDGKIFHLIFNNKIDLGKIFLRFQEHYESPKFAGKSFTLNEFKKWYMTENGDKTFNYYFDWTGYNFPDTVFKSFILSDFPELTDEEKTFIGMFSNVKGKFYVIGTIEGDSDTIKHELAHARYYLNPVYRFKIKRILHKYDTKRIKDYLRKRGYGSNVLVDEIHAYMVSSPSLILKEDAEKFYSSMIEEIQKVFKDEYSKIL